VQFAHFDVFGLDASFGERGAGGVLGHAEADEVHS